MPVAYVGHPLADELPEYPDKDAAREQMRLPQEQTVVALLPGSRQSEVRQMGELFAATAKLIAEQVPERALPGAAGEPRDPNDFRGGALPPGAPNTCLSPFCSGTRTWR